ncbi:MAG: GerMN domain-containing protein [Clostridia bacterium]|nr:GerMN domain-containing protein [Clostridia bacterium]
MSKNTTEGTSPKNSPNEISITTDTSSDELMSRGVSKVKLKLYFTNKDNSAVPFELREVVVRDGAIIKAAVQALLEGPKNTKLKKAIPNGTRLLGVNKKGNVAIVDFSKEYSTAGGVAEIVERVSIVNTLTQIPGIQKVRILVEGKALIGPSGMPLGDLAYVELDSNGYPISQEKKTITVYFGNSNADGVVAEKRVVVVNKGAGLEKAIFEELKKGPTKKGLFPVIPQGTKLLSVQTKSGLCTINLSREFVDNNHTGTAGESMTINSIVNSLTELSTVKKVQFLIEGKVRPAYIHLVFDKPFVRNESMIKNN